MAARDPIKLWTNLTKNYMSNYQQTNATFPWTGSVEREMQKRKADDISISECEVFSFLTHNTTSQEQAKQLLDIIINVRSRSNTPHDYARFPLKLLSFFQLYVLL